MQQRFLIVLLCLLFKVPFISCSVFYSSERPRVDFSKNIKNKSISYELIGWDDEADRRRISYILSALQSSGKFSTVRYQDPTKTDVHVQIILESSPRFKFFLGEASEPVSYLPERDPIRFGVYLINRFLAISTFFVIPDVDRDDDYLVFRLSKKGKPYKEFRYPMESYRVFGWVSLLLMWGDDSKEWKPILTEKVSEFLGDTSNEL
ncbi:hypothetical protein ND861_16725 [Leptospira sp. 2 VSF19]|uniref:Lipoprotein n=1 Tax=Leptospira soteropolitanensis TaxID=2950025 RepID=A0AAW5VGK9_9LEPT|nr:hypothetical protein [Leptospira soteropolitanensis]MCW7494293.1 hypothetical protein [Leptospira soteropolitanensis]MCW7501998.1 hypothetical protein [Leptospira soteropolitanensis]MCW7524139.1 hypothetical protein [Leptospira soteropolitanensis]MCW7528004.1 hypothetical protein [Leptospira soteropolitanensis]MCW7531858.1 hypothetical protein [Leptospira soteropolitanensis]